MSYALENPYIVYRDAKNPTMQIEKARQPIRLYVQARIDQAST